MRPLSTLVVAFVLLAPPAYAEMLPAYDPEMICSDVAGTSARQEMVMRGCLDFQARMKKELTLSWDKVPQPVQTSCSKAASASGDYWRLKSCIDQASAAATH